MQLPDGALPTHPPPLASVTVTVPVGVPEDEVTVNRTVIVAPCSEGSGLSSVIVVVVPAGGGGAAVTVWGSVSELAAKLELPANVAVRFRVPTPPGIKVQLPEGAEIEHDPPFGSLT